MPASVKNIGSDFFRHLAGGSEQRVTRYWNDQFEGVQAAQFPALPQASCLRPSLYNIVEIEIPTSNLIHANLSLTSTIWTAWIVLQARYTQSQDVVFGITTASNDAFERPYVVPFRILLNANEMLRDLLRRINQQATDMVPFARIGLQRIRCMSDEAARCCSFQALLLAKEGAAMPFAAPQQLQKLAQVPMFVECIGSSASKVIVRLTHDCHVVDCLQASRMLAQFKHILTQIRDQSTQNAPIQSLTACSDEDLHDIWSWNETLPNATESTLHHLVTRVAQDQPEALGISAWDGEMTYGQIEEFSTQLAGALVDRGIDDGAIVPLLFNKSKWVPVAILAVLKSGAAFAPIDPRTPVERREALLEALGCKLVLSNACMTSASELLHIRVPEDISGMHKVLETVDTVNPAATAYVIFTSGSEGLPKGVCVAHRAAATSILAHGKLIGYSTTTRMLNFSSLSFDASIAEILTTLCFGGCICIPSDTERMEDLGHFISTQEVNMAFLTPSVLRTLAQSAISSLKTLVCGGEIADPGLFEDWAKRTNLIHAYGPTEACVYATLCHFSSTTFSTVPIGNPIAGCMWVVDPDNCNRLTGIGMPGELLIEGPTLAERYLNDACKTAKAFLEDPQWYTEIGLSHLGRPTCRLYRTGDIVRYRSDGALEFIGRKDGQMRIRGQRVELGELEHHINRLLLEGSGGDNYKPQVVVDAVILSQTAEPRLVAFVTLACAVGLSLDSRKALIHDLMTALDDRLATKLPAHLIPAGYLELDRIPVSLAGKTDRAYLRAFGSSYTLKTLGSFKPRQRLSRVPDSEQERALQILWASTLQLELNDIDLEDTFLRLGGNSILAMKLCQNARKAGWRLTVTDILNSPKLESMAQMMTRHEGCKNRNEVAPFSLLPTNVDVRDMKEQVALSCGVEFESISDVFRALPLQEGLLTLTAKRPGDYIATTVFELTENTNLVKFASAWAATVAFMPILRTWIVSIRHTNVLFQAILDVPIPLTQGKSLQDLLAMEQCRSVDQQTMSLNTPLCSAAIIDRGLLESPLFVLSLHHSLYDGWSWDAVLTTLQCAYHGLELPQQTPIQNFVQYFLNQDTQAGKDFWQQQFEGAEALPFPQLASPSYQPRADRDCSRRILNLSWPADVTPAITIRAAWAVLQSQFIYCDEAIFGAVISGREAPMAGIENVAGPTIATVPIRIVVDPEGTVSRLLEQVHKQARNMTKFEHAGLQNIRNISKDAANCCRFQTLLVVQQKSDSYPIDKKYRILHERGLAWSGERVTPDGIFNNYAIAVEFTSSSTDLLMRISHDSNIVDREQAERLLEQFEHVLRQFMFPAHAEMRIGDVDWVSGGDIRDIWSWNSDVPPEIRVPVHNIITASARRAPNALAVHAWDGQFTYGDLDRLATLLAQHLMSLPLYHAGPGSAQTFVLCFEKSKWMSIAMLGVMKAGGTSLALDVTLPEPRLRRTIQQAKSAFILSSAEQHDLAVSLSSACDGIDHIPIILLPLQDRTTPLCQPLRVVDPSTTLYITFTSGSTGEPKGVCISHANFASALHYQSSLVGLTPTSRAMDLASYAFDVAWATFLFTMAAGACLCVPSNRQRLNPVESIISFEADHVGLTPSMASTIQPASVPTLKTLLLAGEPVTAKLIQTWVSRLHLVQLHGPSECSAGAGGKVMVGSLNETQNVGRTLGLNSWIVDKGGRRLASIGAVGELWLEGPLVGQGYLVEEERIAKSFVRDLPWLLQGTTGFAGRTGRLYRTGDLVKYNSVGELKILGRLDRQVKIRGQRLELGEVEVHVRYVLGMPDVTVVAEVITPQGSDTSILVAFLQASAGGILAEQELVNQLCAKIAQLKDALASRLPPHMVPSNFVPVTIPVNSSGKVDRKMLRQMGAQYTREDLCKFDGTSGPWSPAMGPIQTQLQRLWSDTLGVEQQSIGRTDSFFRYGDSISAMRLSAAAQRYGWKLAATDILKHPRLEEMAQFVRFKDTSHVREPPFSLLQTSEPPASLRRRIAQYCSVEESHVVDAFPCLPMQAALLAMTSQHTGDYVAKINFPLLPSVVLERLLDTLHSVIAALPTLRTRIVDLDGLGLVQTELTQSDDIVFDVASVDTPSALEPLQIGLGTALHSISIVRRFCGRGAHLVWQIHHAVYDDVSMGLILKLIEETYQGSGPSTCPPFSNFVRHVSQIDESEAISFWRQQFEGMEACHFPTLPSTSAPRQQRADSVLQHHINSLPPRNHEATAATMIRAAWALLQSSHTNIPESLFGVVVSGRHAPIEGIDRMIGPTIATVPVRTIIDKRQTISELLQQVQEQSFDAVPFEQMGLDRIGRINKTCRQACIFQNLLVVSVRDKSALLQKSRVFDRQSVDIVEGQESLGAFNTYAMVLDCDLHDVDLDIRLNYDSSVVSEMDAQIIIEQFISVLQQIMDPGNLTMPLASISLASENDLRRIAGWNDVLPATAHACVHDLITSTMRPQDMAMHAWDGNLTYHQLDEFSTDLAEHIVELGVKPGDVVSLCFEKSMWMPVAALGVMKAGAASVALDVESIPEAHLRYLACQVQPKLSIASTSSITLARRLHGCETLSLGTSDPPRKRRKDTILPVVDPASLLYVIFTSGTTRVPKAVAISHCNFASAIESQQQALHFNRDSRVYDFASYAFDSSWSNMLHTFAAGGCLCIPSESDRLDNLATSFTSLGANYIDVTPSVCQSLDPAALPSLQTLVLGGEMLRLYHIEQFKRDIRIINTYGPAECTVVVTADEVDRTSRCHPAIGRAIGARIWIVEPEEGRVLVGVGCVGEIWIEGPLVGSGYLNAPDLTAAAFTQSPPWMYCAAGSQTYTLRQSGSEKFPNLAENGYFYRTGDLARFLHHGRIEYIGRKDNQVKIRGQRVELEAIDNLLTDCLTIMHAKPFPEVASVVTTLPGHSKAELITFMSSASNDFLGSTSLISDLTTHLVEGMARSVLSVMVPSAFRRIKHIPRTVNGKKDRAALCRLAAQPTEASQMRNTMPQPVHRLETRSSAEEILRWNWAEVLRLDISSIPLDVPFTQVGGDSISAMQVVSRCRNAKLAISVKQHKELRTIEKIAAATLPVEAACIHLPEAFPEEWGLSPIQQWYFDAHPDGINHYNQALSVELSRIFSTPVLQEAVLTVAKQHSMLRARFFRRADGIRVQRIAPFSIDDVRISFHDVEDNAQVMHMASLQQGGLDIMKGPVFAADVFHLQNGRQIILLTAHHLVTDLVSWNVVFDGIEHQLRDGEEYVQDSCSFSTWCQEQEYHMSANTHNRSLAIESLASTIAFWDLNAELNTYGHSEAMHFTLDQRTTSCLLERKARAYNSHPVDVLLGCLLSSFQQVFNSRGHLHTMLESHGREAKARMDVSSTVGWFTTLSPISLPPGNITLAEIISSVKTTRESPAEFSFADYRTPGVYTPFELAFNYMGPMRHATSLFQPFGIVPNQVSPEAKRLAIFDLAAQVNDEGKLHMVLTFNKGVRCIEEIKSWWELYRQTLEKLLAEGV